MLQNPQGAALAGSVLAKTPDRICRPDLKRIRSQGPADRASFDQALASVLTLPS